MAVRDIAARFESSRPAISKHLAVLEKAGLVKARRSGRERKYSIAPEALRITAGYAAEIEAFWKRGLVNLDTVLRRERRETRGSGDGHRS
jgi:DNA-binding transcriptional ArsR family regulator